MGSQKEYIKEKIALLPDKPGIYQFFDTGGNVIYVGKAKNLKKRVASYFNKKQPENYRLKMLINKIRDVEYIVVETESDALLLENNLIKKYQPKYNVQLKDDKTFPWICIKNEPFPRVFSTRTIIKDGSEYYGPYTSSNMVRILLDLIRKIYPLRTCRYNLTEENIKAGKFRSCLEYHIGNCKAPCVGKQSQAEYDKNLQHIRKILKGNIQEVIHYMEDLMWKFSQNYQFEEAQSIKEKIDLLGKYKSRSTVVNPRITNIDVFGVLVEKNTIYVNYLKVLSGRIVQAHTVEVKRQLEEKPSELLPLIILDIREKTRSESKEIVVPFNVEFPLANLKVTVPQKGDKKKLLELSERNLKYYHLERMKKKEMIQKKFDKKKILEQLQSDLRLDSLPVHIECFDNSNIQGSHPVAACVVFRDGKPSKKEYRHYNIKTVEGPDDFASMEEVVSRRYKRLLEEGDDLPQLVIIDGGKGQLSSAMISLDKLGLREEIGIIGIAKKLEEIYFPNDSVPLYLDKNSPALRIIQNLRDEAHRFGISFHRQKRSQHFTSSELETIEGIGNKTAVALLSHFKSVEKIKGLSEEKIAEVIGPAKAKIIYRHFHDQENLT
ncbi:MAG: excinuclease ABC subunit UvrC [Bacteroidales bacterium]